MSRIAVVYYSSTGHVFRMAKALAEGAEEQGAEVRLRRCAELAPDEVVQGQDAWREHLQATSDVEEATPDDLDWADGYALGTPTRFGLPSAQLKQFIDQCGPIWQQGKLADKPATSFTSAINQHGGQESTILALNNIFYHWGALIVPPGYTDPLLYESGGNPYGTSLVAGQDSAEEIPDANLASVRYQGARLARFANTLAAEVNR